ncbi:kinesin light chain 3 isoform X1 [Tanacetum coccineum]
MQIFFRYLLTRDLLQIATVLYLQGNGKDAESLIKDSIRIFEDGEQGESFLCMRRLRYLVQNPDYCCLIFFLTSLPPPYRRLSNMASSTPKILLAYIVVASQIPNRPSSFLSSLTGTASTSLPPLRQLIHHQALLLSSSQKLHKITDQLFCHLLSFKSISLFITNTSDSVYITSTLQNIIEELIISISLTDPFHFCLLYQKTFSIINSFHIIVTGNASLPAIYVSDRSYPNAIYINSNKLTDAVIIQRKILHTMEVSKGWDSLETVIAAESLALILQSAGSLIEAKQLLQRCLDSRRRLLPADHIQIAANMLHMARVELLLYTQSRDSSTAVIDKAKDLIGNAIRIARRALDKSMKHGSNPKFHEISRTETYSARTALLILMQGLNALSQLEVTNVTLQESGVKHEEILPHPEAEKKLLDCVSAFKQFGIQMSLADFGDIKGEYLSCLKHLSVLLGKSINNSLKRPTMEELLNEIKRVEGESAMPNQKP